MAGKGLTVAAFRYCLYHLCCSMHSYTATNCVDLTTDLDAAPGAR